MVSSIGPLSFCSGACGHNPPHSSLANVVFNLGEDELPSYANDLIHAFGCALQYLRSEIITRFMLPEKRARLSFDLLSLLYEHHGQPLIDKG